MMDSPPVGKKKALNPHRGAQTIPKEFLNRLLAGPEVTRNLISLSPFKVDSIYYTQGRFGKGLEHILGKDKLPVLPVTCELARLLMIQAHEQAYMGGSDTCARSRQEAWIVHA